MAGSSDNFVDTQGVSLSINGIIYTQLLNVIFDIDSDVTKHQLTDDTIDNVFSLRMNSIQGNMVVTTTEYAALVALTTDTTGALQNILVTNDGSGYSSVGELVTLTGLSSGANDAIAFATVNGSNVVTAITIIDGGSGYTDTEIVSITGQISAANDATGEAAVTTGTITSVGSISGGSGYSQSGEPVTLDGTGSDGTGFAFITSSEITSVSITNVGSGYTDGESITLDGDISSADDARGDASIQVLARSQVSCIIVWTDSSGSTKTTTFSGQIKTLRPIDEGLGLVTIFFSIEADQGVTVT